jgi:hypothetical protein
MESAIARRTRIKEGLKLVRALMLLALLIVASPLLLLALAVYTLTLCGLERVKAVVR